MIPLRLLAVALALGAIPSGVRADDLNHFRGFPPPPDEARILALTGVQEYCCHYEITFSASQAFHLLPGSQVHYQGDVMLFAEVYSGTTCIARYRLADSVNAFDDLGKPLTGTISLGWNEERHELISVIDNRQLYSPWHASVHLPDFDPVDAHFFEDSAGEKRHSAQSGDFVIYPVAGLCGDRRLKIPGGYEKILTAQQLLGLYQFVRAKNAVILYAFPTEGGDPPLHFDRIPDPRAHSFLPAWVANGTGAVILFLMAICLILVWRAKKAQS